jgi:hypothetical protein
MKEIFMINSLTKKQISKFPIYVDKWIKIGLSTEQISFDDTKNIVDNFYKNVLLYKNEPLIIIMDSPLSAWYATLFMFYCINNQVRNQVENQVSNQVSNQVWNQVRNQVSNQVWNQVRNQVSNQVWNQVSNQVENQVENQVSNQVNNQVSNQVNNQVWNQVNNQVWNQVRNQVSNQVSNQVNNQVWNQVENFIYPYTDNNFMSSYFAYIEYMQKELNVEQPPTFEIYKETTKLGLMYCFPEYCVVSKKPTEIHMKNGILHNENGPAIKYNDLDIYSLNGVNVSKEIVTTSWNKLDSKLILKESNAEVRREIVRKIGIEKICKDLNANVIDKKYNYELLLLDINDNNPRPYLKMKNPSIGVYHIEGVGANCKTVEDALLFRKPTDMKKIPISENGEDWYQQGDVCIWNKNAKSLKLYPKILT